MKKVGFIGLGIMGESMSENIVKKSSLEVWVFDFVDEKVKQLEKIGAIAAKSSEEIAENCDVIITMVPKDEHVKAVYDVLLSKVREGTILIDMSTITPSTSVSIAKEAKEKGCVMIDAPVVKSKPAAIEGKLGIYVGGDRETFEEVKPILSCMGNNIIHMGDNGAGLTMKICHNMLVAEIQNGVNEMLVLAENSGLNFDDVIKAIGYGGGQNFYLDGKKNAIKEGNFATAFSVANMHKDINIAVKQAKELGIDLKGANVVKEIYQKAMDQELGNEDFSATIKVVREDTKS
ncbi:NAD(P)-dependent oxidoreductase [Clostridium sp. DL1XJH146]